MKLVMLGAPGSGKGTLAQLLSKQLGVPHISPGEILREELKLKSRLGREAKPFMEKGELVPDEVILEMMEKRISQPDCQRGFILDGFPRTAVQAESLDRMLASSKKGIDIVLELEVSKKTVMRRLGGRRICSVCGADFNVYTKPSAEDDRCDLCGGRLFQREDDKEKVIAHRLKVYRKETRPLEEYYNHQGKLIRINSEPDADLVLKEILKVLQGG
jgi:adenylate kinase